MRRATSTAVVVIAMAMASVAVFLLWRLNPSVVAENHLVEWLEVVFLLIAAAVHGVRAKAAAVGVDRTLRHGLMLLCLSLAVREVDIDKLLEGGSAMVVTEWTVRAVIVALWAVYILLARQWVDAIWSQRAVIASSTFASFVLIGCALYAASWPFDKFPEYLGGTSVAMLIEETVQLCATISFFASAALGIIFHQPQLREAELSTSADVS